MYINQEVNKNTQNFINWKYQQNKTKQHLSTITLLRISLLNLQCKTSTIDTVYI